MKRRAFPELAEWDLSCWSDIFPVVSVCEYMERKNPFVSKKIRENASKKVVVVTKMGVPPARTGGLFFVYFPTS